MCLLIFVTVASPGDVILMRYRLMGCFRFDKSGKEKFTPIRVKLERFGSIPSVSHFTQCSEDSQET